MPVVFLVPAILGGMLALGVPLLLHLRRRERERPMRFPSLMFLQRVTISTARRRRITDWPLLMLRALIVALAVLAFARPVIRPHPGAAP
ncbi:MAG TPA: BatA domain-containing protein, partial [Gemmatimonadales bacterium]